MEKEEPPAGVADGGRNAAGGEGGEGDGHGYGDGDGASVSYLSDIAYLHIAYIVPTFSAVSSALPDVYLIIYLVEAYKTSYGVAGVAMTMLHLAAIFGSFANMAAPKASSLVLLVISLAGYCGLLFEESPTNLIRFVAWNFCTAISGDSPYLQILAKDDFANNSRKMRSAISMQWINNGLGFGVGAYLSGSMYQWFGIRGIALTGMAAQFLSLSSLVHYLFLSKRNKKTMQQGMTAEHGGGVGGNDDVSPDQSIRQDGFPEQCSRCSGASSGPSTGSEEVEKSSTVTKTICLPGVDDDDEKPRKGDVSSNPNICSDQDQEITEVGEDVEDQSQIVDAGLVREKMRNSFQSGTLDESFANRFSESKLVKKNTFMVILPLMWAFDPITAGGIQTIAPLFISSVFGRSESEIGILIAVATICGTVISLLFESNLGDTIHEYLPTPYDMHAMFALVGVATCLLLVPSYAVQVLSIVLVLVFSGPLLVTITEVQGAVTTARYFRSLGPMSSVLNQSLYLGMSLLLPFLYGVDYRLPYIVMGSLALSCAVLFIWMIQRQSQANNKKLKMLRGGMDEDDTLGDKPALDKRMSFVSREMLARTMSTFSVGPKS